MSEVSATRLRTHEARLMNGAAHMIQALIKSLFPSGNGACKRIKRTDGYVYLVHTNMYEKPCSAQPRLGSVIEACLCEDSTAMSKSNVFSPIKSVYYRTIPHSLFGIDLSNRHGCSCGNTLGSIHPLSLSEIVLPGAGIATFRLSYGNRYPRKPRKRPRKKPRMRLSWLDD